MQVISAVTVLVSIAVLVLIIVFQNTTKEVVHDDDDGTGSLVGSSPANECSYDSPCTQKSGWCNHYITDWYTCQQAGILLKDYVGFDCSDDGKFERGDWGTRPQGCWFNSEKVYFNEAKYHDQRTARRRRRTGTVDKPVPCGFEDDGTNDCICAHWAAWKKPSTPAPTPPIVPCVQDLTYQDKVKSSSNCAAVSSAFEAWCCPQESTVDGTCGNMLYTDLVSGGTTICYNFTSNGISHVVTSVASVSTPSCTPANQCYISKALQSGCAGVSFSSSAYSFPQTFVKDTYLRNFGDNPTQAELKSLPISGAKYYDSECTSRAPTPAPTAFPEPSSSPFCIEKGQECSSFIDDTPTLCCQNHPPTATMRYCRYDGLSSSAYCTETTQKGYIPVIGQQGSTEALCKAVPGNVWLDNLRATPGLFGCDWGQGCCKPVN